MLNFFSSLLFFGNFYNHSHKVRKEKKYFSREILFSPNSDIPKKWTFSHRSFESSEEKFPDENFLHYSQSLVPKKLTFFQIHKLRVVKKIFQGKFFFTTLKVAALCFHEAVASKEKSVGSYPNIVNFGN